MKRHTKHMGMELVKSRSKGMCPHVSGEKRQVIFTKSTSVSSAESTKLKGDRLTSWQAEGEQADKSLVLVLPRLRGTFLVLICFLFCFPPKPGALSFLLNLQISNLQSITDPPILSLARTLWLERFKIRVPSMRRRQSGKEGQSRKGGTHPSGRL